MNLTRCEQEVVINLNADEDMTTVYNANPAWIRKMDKLVRIGKPRELSLAQREKYERMRAGK